MSFVQVPRISPSPRLPAVARRAKAGLRVSCLPNLFMRRRAELTRSHVPGVNTPRSALLTPHSKRPSGDGQIAGHVRGAERRLSVGRLKIVRGFRSRRRRGRTSPRGPPSLSFGSDRKLPDTVSARCRAPAERCRRLSPASGRETGLSPARRRRYARSRFDRQELSRKPAEPSSASFGPGRAAFAAQVGVGTGFEPAAAK